MQPMENFSLNPETLRLILTKAKPLGHHQEPKNLNLGFGFLYYGLIRALRPKHILVIGSGFGFSVVCLALGAKDNAMGRVTFVDPSFSLWQNGPFKTIGGNNKWKDPEKVKAHFARLGVAELVTHYKLTSAEFFELYQTFGLPKIDLAFIDGSHAFKDVKFDFMSVLKRSSKNTYILLHDTNIYIREAIRHAGVKRWLKHLSHYSHLFEQVNFPFSSGVALVRVLQDEAWNQLSG